MSINIIQKGDLDPKSFKNNGTNNKGGISLALSKEPGNLLSMYPDGLHYGVQAAADVYRQYVDAEKGDDNNSGGRTSPLKTLDKALSRVSDDKTSFIYLKCSTEAGVAQVYEYSSFAVTGSAIRYIYGYDDPYLDGSVYSCYRSKSNNVYSSRGSAITRPILRQKWRKEVIASSNVQKPSLINVTISAKIAIVACDLEFTPALYNTTDFPVSGNETRSVFKGGGTKVLVGVRVVDRNFALQLHSTNIPYAFEFDTVEIVNQRDYSIPNAAPLLNVSKTSLSLTLRYFNVSTPDIIAACGDANPALTNNIVERLRQSGAISGVIRQNGVPLNVTAPFTL